MEQIRTHQIFLKWALINVLFLLALGVGMVSYGGKVEVAGKVATGVVILVYLAASAMSGYAAWRMDLGKRLHLARNLPHLSLAIEISPMIAMLGTVGGFMIAFGSSAGDVQHRVIGASTGLAATLVGISCTVVLMVIRHLLEEA